MSARRNVQLILALCAMTFMFLASPLKAADPAHVEAYKSVAAGRCSDDSPCDLSNADLSGIRRNFIDLTNANAQGADFSEARLSNIKAVKANMSGANFMSTQFVGGTIQQSNLRGANLQNAVGKHWFAFHFNDLTNANLTGARIELLEATESPNILCNTTMPDGTISNRDC